MATQATSLPSELTWPHVLVLLWMRWVFSITFRLVYPLLAFLAASFAIDLSAASLLVTMQVAAALLSPLGGFLSDRIGDRATLIGGSGLFVIGTIICALSANFGLFLLGYATIGLSLAAAIPALQSYVSARSRYERRGQMLGVLELSWALAALLGVPAIAWLAETYHLAMAFTVLTGAGALAMLLCWTLPADSGAHASAAATPTALLGVIGQPIILATLAFIFVQLTAVELIFVNFAGWLSAAFKATTAQLGLVFGMLGVVELAGSTLATLFTDRIGKRRAVLAGFGLVGVCLLLLSQSSSWPIFLFWLLAFDLCFEFAIVSTFPLVSGLSAQGRGTVLAAMTASIGAGRIAGSLIGPWLSLQLGYATNSALAGALALIGVALAWRFVGEGRA